MIKSNGQGRNVGLSAGLALLPCAHCGSEAVLYEQNRMPSGVGGGCFIECDNPECWMTTPVMFASIEFVGPMLAKVWNRRADAEINRRGFAAPELNALLCLPDKENEIGHF